MATVKISALPAATAPFALTDLAVVVKGGVTSKVNPHVFGDLGGTTATATISAGALNLSAVVAGTVRVTLNANVTSITLPSGLAGTRRDLVIEMTQDATGGRTVSGWPSVAIQGGSTTMPPVFSAASSVTVFHLTNVDNGGWRLVGMLGGTLTGALNGAVPVSLASAATVNIGAAAANTVNITGTTGITAFDSIAAGAARRLVFAGALTLTHNATSLILPTGANITTAAGDVAEFESLGGGNWKCVDYLRADGTAIALPGTVVLTSTDQSIGGVKTFTGAVLRMQSNTPGVWMDEADGSFGVYAVLDGGVLQIQRRASGFGAFQATIASINGAAPSSSFAIASDGAVSLSGVYGTTTANAANVNVASSGLLARSTSSTKYKTEIEQMEPQYAESALALEPIWYRSLCPGDRSDWSWWGFSAEQAAQVDPRLVHWRTHERVVEAIEKPAVDDNGNPITDADGVTVVEYKEVIRFVELQEPEPEGVAYERLVVHHTLLLKQHHDKIRQQQGRLDEQDQLIADLSRRLKALETPNG